MQTTQSNYFVREIRENDRIDGTFLVKYKALQLGKSGKPYLNVVLMDRTGEIEARLWEDAERLNSSFDKDDFVRVKARAQAYQGRLQLNLFEIVRCRDEDVDMADYLPASKKDIETMFAELCALIDSVGDVYLRGLLCEFVTDTDLAWRIKTAPAAKSMHHVFVGGLLEHTLSAMKVARLLATHYQAEGYTGINPDLLLTGIFLHDIGKIFELTYRRGFDYSDAGRLVGHHVIGVELVNEKVKRIPGFPEELRLLVNHMIIAHHGELEYGSPKRPKTIEALMVHAIDDLDSKINSFTQALEKDTTTAGPWTAYNKLYERFLWKKIYRSQVVLGVEQPPLPSEGN